MNISDRIEALKKYARLLNIEQGREDDFVKACHELVYGNYTKGLDLLRHIGLPNDITKEKLSEMMLNALIRHIQNDGAVRIFNEYQDMLFTICPDKYKSLKFIVYPTNDDYDDTLSDLFRRTQEDYCKIRIEEKELDKIKTIVKFFMFTFGNNNKTYIALSEKIDHELEMLVEK